MAYTYAVHNGLPFELDDFLATIVDALKLRGDARSITSLVEGDCKLGIWDSDFGIDAWRLTIALPVRLFYAMTDEDRALAQESIKAIAESFFSGLPGHVLEGVAITPQVSSAKTNWREDALQFVRGEGVTNQGRVRSDNIASKEHRGLLFRSKAEITLFEALTRAGLAVSPLPVFVRIGKSYNRLEPDFVVVFKGLTFVVEVDGDTYHKETPADAEKRLIPLTYEGVEVRRIRAAELTSAAEADFAVKQLVEFMAKRKEAR
jgi:hypothetical protein